MSRFVIFSGAVILLVWAIFGRASNSADVANQQILSISEEPSRIVLGWSGPIEAPMSERVAAALDRYKTDKRRLVLILNSPGGSIEHGRKVVATIRARDRTIDTLVQKAGVCASMCVPIFLAGNERMADPEAFFMFHRVSFKSSAKEDVKRRELSASEEAMISQFANIIKTQATDDFFRSDIGIRGVNTVWLSSMLRRISNGDVWMSGQQLMNEASGIVDKLIRT